MYFVPLIAEALMPNSFKRSFSPVTASAIASTASMTGLPIAAAVSPKVFSNPAFIGSIPNAFSFTKDSVTLLNSYGVFAVKSFIHANDSLAFSLDFSSVSKIA